MRSLYNPEDRSLMQPSFVFAGLALATLMKSSEMELGTAGRTRAAWLRDQAQASLEASWNAQWIDITLAKAALVRPRLLPCHRLFSHDTTDSCCV